MDVVAAAAGRALRLGRGRLLHGALLLLLGRNSVNELRSLMSSTFCEPSGIGSSSIVMWSCSVERRSSRSTVTVLPSLGIVSESGRRRALAACGSAMQFVAARALQARLYWLGLAGGIDSTDRKEAA